MEDHLLYITSLYAFFILENMVSRRNFEVDQEELCWDAFMHNSCHLAWIPCLVTWVPTMTWTQIKFKNFNSLCATCDKMIKNSPVKVRLSNTYLSNSRISNVRDSDSSQWCDLQDLWIFSKSHAKFFFSKTVYENDCNSSTLAIECVLL